MDDKDLEISLLRKEISLKEQEINRLKKVLKKITRDNNKLKKQIAVFNTLKLEFQVSIKKEKFIVDGTRYLISIKDVWGDVVNGSLDEEYGKILKELLK